MIGKGTVLMLRNLRGVTSHFICYRNGFYTYVPSWLLTWKFSHETIDTSNNAVGYSIHRYKADQLAARSDVSFQITVAHISNSGCTLQPCIDKMLGCCCRQHSWYSVTWIMICFITEGSGCDVWRTFVLNMKSVSWGPFGGSQEVEVQRSGYGLAYTYRGIASSR